MKTTTSLQPIPEYCMYQDQAEELDLITTRISRLVDALKRRGIYDASAEGSDNQLSQLADAADNQFLPYKNFSVLLEKGGLANVFMTEDLKPIIEVLDKLQQHRITLVQTIYEITGITDIIRGASNPNETATARQGSRFPSTEGQKRIQTFIRDLFRIKAEIMAEHFTREQLQEMTSIDMPLKAEQDAAKQQLINMSMQEQLAKALQAQAQQPPPGGPAASPPAPGQAPPGGPPGVGGGGAPPPGPATELLPPPGPSPSPSPVPPAGMGMLGGAPPPPPDPKLKERLLATIKATSWEDISAILRSDQRRGYRVDIQTDSLTQVNDEAEKKQRIEFLSVMQKFAETSIPGIISSGDGALRRRWLRALAPSKVGRTAPQWSVRSPSSRRWPSALQRPKKQDPRERRSELEAKAKMMGVQGQGKGAMPCSSRTELQHVPRLKEMEFSTTRREREEEQELSSGAEGRDAAEGSGVRHRGRRCNRGHALRA